MQISGSNELKSPPFVVALAGDEFYFVHLVTCINSILKNTKNHNRLKLLILDGGLTEEQKAVIRKIGAEYYVEVIFETEALHQYRNFPIKTRIATAPTYYRISLAEIIPNDIPYALYIDSDTVVEKDVFELLKYTRDEGYAVWAVEDISDSGAHKLLGIKKNNYFNAGVMMINLAYWRENDIGEKIREFKLHNSTKILGNDGGAINGVLSSLWGRLPPKWNQQSGLYKKKFRKGNKISYSIHEINDALRDPAIIHYVGERKPWLAGCPHPLSNRYWFYRHDLGIGNDEVKISEELKKILKKPHHFIRKLWYKTIYY